MEHDGPTAVPFLLLDVHGHLSGAVAVDYGMSGVPESYFVDRDGRLVRKWQGPLDEARLRSYLDELVR